MNQIKIKHFGPLKDGLAENDGFIDIKKVTIFIGNQGTGKSSVAKLISTLSWIEKALYRGNYTEKYITGYNRFIKEFCNYQNLKNYFLPETEIEYRGHAYNIQYSDSKLSINRNNTKQYKVPKIMYIPAERNFLSAVSQPEKLKGLPLSLYTFLEELERSQQELSGSLTLPIDNTKFEFDKSNKISHLVGNDYKIRLSEASSGFQSFVPLFLVSRNIALSINKEKDSSIKELSMEEQKRLEAELKKILLNENLSDEVKEKALELLSSRYKNECFLNIVEEIEQNLFPKSQKDIFYKLLEFVNMTKDNKLILTTHSPYIISYLTLAIKGYAVWQKILTDTLKQQLEKIVPEVSCVSAEDAVIYELTEEGKLQRLPSYDGLPSDENYLNKSLAETNDLFVELLEIEDQI